MALGAALRWTEAAAARDRRRAARLGMAYDARTPAGRPLRRRERIRGQLGDTWEWDGTAVGAGLHLGPLPSWWPALLVYDSHRQRIVGFGGIRPSERENAGRNVGVGRRHHGSLWARRAVPEDESRPGVRLRRKRVVLFGGNPA